MINSPHLRAGLQALFVTFLWSTSWVLIKVGLEDIPPLTFAGLRYSLAFLILLPGTKQHWPELRGLSRRRWGTLVVLGIVFYPLTQGGQFLALKFLPAVTFSLLLNFTSALVMLAGALLLNESPSGFHWLGMLVFISGVLAYFHPLVASQFNGWGLLFAGITVASNAAASLLGRSVNRARLIPPVVVTSVSMGTGTIALVSAALVTEGLPKVDPQGWLTICWLAVVNTALAFSLWNRTLQELTATESSIINNSMLIQIALLAWLFLGEPVSPLDAVGLALATAGILIVNLRTA